MKITVYGPGCMKCKKTEELVRNVLVETGFPAQLEKVTDIQAIAAAQPALCVPRCVARRDWNTCARSAGVAVARSTTRGCPGRIVSPQPQ